MDGSMFHIEDSHILASMYYTSLTSTLKIKPSTDVAASHFNTFATSVGMTWTFTAGSETTVNDSGNTKYNLVLVTSTTVKTGDASDNATPSELDSMVMTKTCE